MNVDRFTDISSTVIRGSRLAYGSWNTICIYGGRKHIHMGDILAVIENRAIRRFHINEAVRPVVVLPQPDSPTRPSVSPFEYRRNVIDRFYNLLFKSLLPATGKYCCKCFTSTRYLSSIMHPLLCLGILLFIKFFLLHQPACTVMDIRQIRIRRHL